MTLRMNSIAAASLAALMVMQPALPAFAQESTPHQQLIQKYKLSSDNAPAALSQSQIEKLIHQKVKYVFVLYQENRSFDSYFGTYPGAEGLYSHPESQTPGYYQEILNVDGTRGMIHPFRIGPNEHAADTDDIDHSHPRIVAKMDVAGNGLPKMDQFAYVEQQKYLINPASNPLQARQYGELAMAYEDCDTVPLLWQYANKFVLFDHIFQQFTGPSTPGNLAIIGAQAGETQLVKHPEQAYAGNGASGPGVPVLNDANPLWGSQKDPEGTGTLVPYNPGDYKSTTVPQYNQGYATLPLTMKGGELATVAKADRDPDGDLEDVRDDVELISAQGKQTVPFGWFEEGYDRESTDQGPLTADGSHASYVTHHNGPQYFGYIANNPQMANQLHGLGDFFSAVDNKSLPVEGGVFFVKGGFQNILGLKPTFNDAKVQTNFLGDDDHPAYSDAQISEALVAESINKIAASPYWKDSAIIVTWDDSEGDYDHVPPPVQSKGPDGSLITDGPRVPLMVISPYSKTNFISHQPGNHSSVVKFIDTVFGLTPLALLPDESIARLIGEETYGQKNLGPQDALTPDISNLLNAFSVPRLKGEAETLPASYATVDEGLIRKLPDTTGYGCSTLGIVTTDRRKGIKNEIPSDFNPRPSTDPSSYTPPAATTAASGAAAITTPAAQ